MDKDLNRFSNKFWIIINLIVWSLIFYLLTLDVSNLKEHKSVYTRILGDLPANTIRVRLPSSITNPAGLHEYCELGKNSNDQQKSALGTPVPNQAVIITPANLQPTQSDQTSQVENLPAVQTPTMAVQNPTFAIPNLEITKLGNFKRTNFHLVFVGIGFDDEENKDQLISLLTKTAIHFTNVHVDFAYVNSPIKYMELTHIGTDVDAKNVQNVFDTYDAIKKVYPIDGLVFIVKTPDDIGTATVNHGYMYILFSSEENNADLYLSHEIGHLLGNSDGYSSVFKESYFPSTELFYLDKMPVSLVKALNEIGKMPPMYYMGACKGRSLYQFYDPRFNIYSDYNPDGNSPWGNSLFTPLQIQIMNDYIGAAK